MASSSIFVSNIPPACTREDLEAHFKQRLHGGGLIDHVLHPLGLKTTKALIAFADSKGEIAINL